MAVIEGTTRPYKAVTAEYDFTVDGGAISTITLRAATGDLGGNVLPSGAVVLGGFVDVATTVTSGGAATVALGLESTTDVLGATAVGSLTAGRKSVIPAFTGATTVKTTTGRSITATIAAFALTAGKFTVVLFYR